MCPFHKKIGGRRIKKMFSVVMMVTQVDGLLSGRISGRCCAARVCQGDVTGRSLGVVAPGLWRCRTKTSVNNPHMTQSLEMTTSLGV